MFLTRGSVLPYFTSTKNKDSAAEKKCSYPGGRSFILTLASLTEVRMYCIPSRFAPPIVLCSGGLVLPSSTSLSSLDDILVLLYTALCVFFALLWLRRDVLEPNSFSPLPFSATEEPLPRRGGAPAAECLRWSTLRRFLPGQKTPSTT